MRFKRIKTIMKRFSLLFLGLWLANAEGRTLAEILKVSIPNDPEILEAQATQMVSEAVLEQSQALLYPTVKAVANQPAFSTGSYRFNPALQASWTLYDFGATKANIRHDRIQTEYYDEKIAETAGEVAFQMATYYLEALRAKLSLEVAQENLNRHKSILGQLEVITQYDIGRRSEFTQAQSRMIQIEESMIGYQRILNLALRNLGRYVKPAVKIDELQDPFLDYSSEGLRAKFPLDKKIIINHPSYQAQIRELRSLMAKLDAAQKGRYPALTLNGSASPEDSSVYLSMSVDVFNKASNPKIQEYEQQIRGAEARVQKIYENLSQRIDVAILQMAQDEKRIETAKRQALAMEQVAIDYEDKFYIANQTLLGVVDAYSDLANAKNLIVQSSYDLMMAKLEYLHASGRLNEWAGWRQITKNDRSKTDIIIDGTSHSETNDTQPLAEVKNAFVETNEQGQLNIVSDVKKVDLKNKKTPTNNQPPKSASLFNQHNEAVKAEPIQPAISQPEQPKIQEAINPFQPSGNSRSLFQQTSEALPEMVETVEKTAENLSNQVEKKVEQLSNQPNIIDQITSSEQPANSSLGGLFGNNQPTQPVQVIPVETAPVQTVPSSVSIPPPPKVQTVAKPSKVVIPPPPKVQVKK